MSSSSPLPVAVLGAGPVGLAAAAHLLEQGFEPLIFEASDQVAASFRDFGHVRLFSPWRYNVDAAARRLLETEGWRMPSEEAIPTAGEMVERYFIPLSRTAAIAGRLHLSSRVVALTRQGFDKVKTAGREQAPFVIRVETLGKTREFLARAIIDATGNWFQPNPLGSNGLPAAGEREHGARVAYGMPDILGRWRLRYEGKRVLVVGAGHSAAGSLLALAQLAERAPDTEIHWAIRGANPRRVFGGGEADGLPARGALGIKLRRLIDGGTIQLHEHFRIEAIGTRRGQLTVTPQPHPSSPATLKGIDEIIAATGSRPDLALTRELRVRLDEGLESVQALAPLIDPNLHSCGTVRPHGHRELSHPEPGFYIVGAKSYGRAPTFLMATGYEQVRSIAAALAGDFTAADDVRLDLPETGVCMSDLDGETGGCCGIPAPATSTAPEPEGCGCTPPPTVTTAPTTAACCA